MRTANLVNNLCHLKFLLIARQSKDARNAAQPTRSKMNKYVTTRARRIRYWLQQQQQANRESVQTESASGRE